MTDELMHYGIKRKSGRYPWGSGGDEVTRAKDFYDYVDTLKNSTNPPLKEKEIAQLIGLETNDDRGFSVANLRDTRTIARETIVQAEIHEARKLKLKEWKDTAIADHMGLTVAKVRLRLATTMEEIKSTLSNTADVLRKNVDKYDIVDIGKGVNYAMGISPERLRAAASILRDEGYVSYNIPQKIVGSKHSTSRMVMVKPGVTFGEARKMADRVHTIGEWTENEGKTFFGISSPLPVSSSRVLVRFKEDGGADEDGYIYVRPGVDDLDMGKNHYAQVRINVDGTHYIKGVAMLRDDVPDGYDIVVNSNKSRTVGKHGALKPLLDDPDNPFGSSIKKQIYDIDPKTGEQRLKSAMNIVNEEGDWDDWRLSLPSQMLSKQPHSLIKSQLKETQKQTKERIDEINSITNPVIRKKKLQDYAEQIDADAVDLRAAAMPGQRTQLIVPIPKMSENEVYAPAGFKTGDDVVLIRYPHGGRFEIPELKVNNNLRNAKKVLGNATDAIGISPKVAEKLSGADFDGDTVIVIPNPKGAIKGIKQDPDSHYYQEKFKNYDPKTLYGGYEVVGTRTKKDGTVEEIGNFPLMKATGTEMGKITNLITDMQIQGAKPEHIVRAVKHSMVVIDAEKHRLNYKQSAEDNNIAQLRELYQMTVREDGSVRPGGASTLLSRATAGVTIPELQKRSAREGGAIDPKTGAVVMVPTNKTKNVRDPKTGDFLDGKDGRPLVTTPKTETYKRLSLTNDAYDLVKDPRNAVEKAYADHANTMKQLANETRLVADKISTPPINKAARSVYKAETDALYADLDAAKSMKPLERRAMQYAAIHVKMKRQEDPTLHLDSDRMKKVERQAVAGARSRLGLEKQVINITDNQWDAIQSGAVSASKLREILDYADPKRVEELSMPRTNTVMTSAISARAKALLASGKGMAEVAASLGVSTSTLKAAKARGDV